VRQFQVLRGAAAEKIHLQVKRPLAHVFVKVSQVGIIGNGFVRTLPAQLFANQTGQGGFAAADIASHQDELFAV